MYYYLFDEISNICAKDVRVDQRLLSFLVFQ